MNHFFLELDTTGPQIDIVAPSYTMPDVKTEIRIISNEALSKYQEIYIIDSEGKRDNLTFTYNINEFIGEIYLNNISFGIATIYARLEDEVGNMSDIATFNINILNGMRLNMELKHKFNRANITKIQNKVNVKPIKSKIEIIKSNR